MIYSLPLPGSGQVSDKNAATCYCEQFSHLNGEHIARRRELDGQVLNPAALAVHERVEGGRSLLG